MLLVPYIAMHALVDVCALVLPHEPVPSSALARVTSVEVLAALLSTTSGAVCRALVYICR